MTLAFVAVSVTHNLKPLNAPIDVFYQNPHPGQFPIVLLFFFGQFLIFPLFYGCYAVCVKLDYPLITAVCQNLNKLINSNKFILKKLEIMRFSRCLRDAYNLFCFAVYDDLRLYCVPLFLS
jgi:hypothetical protein